MKSAAWLAVLAGSLVLGCSDDEATPIDAPVAIDAAADAPVIDAPVIDAPIDAPVIDARPIDAAIDAVAIDAPIDAPGPVVVNGCTPQQAADATAPGANRTIAFVSFAYTPKCILIAAGQSATFAGAFGSHPLVPGAVVGGVPMPAPGGPIVATSTGTTATFAFPTPGTYPYYCQFHGGGGMTGVVYVQ